jgi:hypothetical protein
LGKRQELNRDLKESGKEGVTEHRTVTYRRSRKVTGNQKMLPRNAVARKKEENRGEGRDTVYLRRSSLKLK